MFIFTPAISNDELELEDGLGNLQLESGDALVLESSSPVVESAIQIVDENPTLAIPYYYIHKSSFLQPDPGTLFEALWLPGTGQQGQDTLMPTYDERYLYGDIANMPYFELQLFDNIHFGPDGVDTFAGPIAVDILEGSADVEIRTPE
jgi:hypothetical protein